MEYFTNDEIFTGKIYTFLFSRWFAGHSHGLESAKQAARKENTEASPPNEKGSKTADEEESKTADEERSNIADEEESKAAHVASLTAADDAKTIRQKKNPHAKRHGGSKNISQNENLS